MLVACLIPHLILRLLRLPSPIPPRFLGLAGHAAGAQVRIIGQPATSQVLMVANHLSWMDILVLGGASRAAFVAKGDIESWPVVGWLASLNQTLFVAREQRRDVARQSDTIRHRLAAGRPLVLFPEGTTNDGAMLRPFKPALFSALIPPPPGIRIQPVLIDYGADATDIAWGDAEPTGANAKRVFARKGPLYCTIHFLPPFDPAEWPDRKALAQEAWTRLNAAFVKTHQAL